jgi:hypothetical protein
MQFLSCRSRLDVPTLMTTVKGCGRERGRHARQASRAAAEPLPECVHRSAQRGRKRTPVGGGCAAMARGAP